MLPVLRNATAARKCRSGEPGRQIRETTVKLAKNRTGPVGRSVAPDASSIIWKMPWLAGKSLWKRDECFFHSDDSRGLDGPPAPTNTRSTRPGIASAFPVVAG
jgi:hypothetical protein